MSDSAPKAPLEDFLSRLEEVDSEEFRPCAFVLEDGSIQVFLGPGPYVVHWEGNGIGTHRAAENREKIIGVMVEPRGIVNFKKEGQ